MKKIAKKIVCANWKMHPLTENEAVKLFTGVAKSLPRVKNTEIVICPPDIYLDSLKKISKKVALGAQDAFVGDVGPFTGEVSTSMLDELGIKYVILGHSERRALGEGNELINKKLKSALASGLKPILCIGERERDESHGYFNIVKTQILECIKGITKDSISKIIFAYEPVWALSTTINRRDATPGDCREMCVFIKKVLSDFSTPQNAAKTRIIYGGSVNEKDVAGFIEEGEAMGVLVGKASLTPEKFIEIIKVCEASKK
jgi:triosephosphate isomerase